MFNIIETVLADGGWQALAVLGSLWLLRMAFDIIKRAFAKDDMSDQTVSTQAATAAQLTSVVAVQTDIQRINAENTSKIAETLVHMAGVLDVHKVQIADLARDNATIKTELSGAVQAMHNTTDRRDKALETLPVQVAGKVSEVMADQLEAIPGAVKAVIAPELQTISGQVEILSKKIDDLLKAPNDLQPLISELKTLVEKLSVILESKDSAAPSAEEKKE